MFLLVKRSPHLRHFQSGLGFRFKSVLRNLELIVDLWTIPTRLCSAVCLRCRSKRDSRLSLHC
jgi:hypothetical protein